MSGVAALAILLLGATVLPMLANKSTEGGRFDWVNPYLREAWFILVIVCVVLYMVTPDGIGIAMKLRAMGNTTRPVFVYCAIAIMCSALGCAYWYLLGVLLPPKHSESVTQPAVTIRPEVSQAQFAELTQLGRFIGKDENDLRETFDALRILHKNIALQITRIKFREAGNPLAFKYTNYTEGDGSFIVNLMEGKYHMTPGGPHVDEGPHDVCFLVTTARYQEAQRTLSNFVNSPLIPESVKERLLAYRVAVNNDFELMIKTLDRFMNAGDDFFLKSEDYGQPKFNGVIQREYFSLFVQLKPKADDVSHELAKYLGTT